jgi:hypothetical protein
MKYLASHRVILKPTPTQQGTGRKKWTPRWEDIQIEEPEQVPVEVTLITNDGLYRYDWILRKQLEWADFSFLVNSKFGNNRWEAEMANIQWTSDDRTPFPNQKIRVFPLQSEKPCKRYEKHLKRKQEAWDRICDFFQKYDDWCLDEVPTEYGDTEPVSNEEDYSIAVELPGEEEIKLMRMPKGNEWAFFESSMNVKLGENQWIARWADDFGIAAWQNRSQMPRPGKRVEVF